MSDENTPKFRLRPKLAGGPPANTPPAPANPPPRPVSPDDESSGDPSAEPLAVWPEAKPTALRPKLSLKPDAATPADDNAGVSKVTPRSEPSAAAVPVPPPAPVKPALTPRTKPTLSPMPEEAKAPDDSGATPPFALPPAGEKKLPTVLNAPPPPKIKVAIPTTETWPAVLDAPPPAGLSPLALPPRGPSAEAEPAEITAIRKASTFPFPSPTAKFPPLPGLGVGGTEPAELPAQEGLLKKLLVLVAAVVLLLGGGAVFAYFKFFAKPSAKPLPPPAPVAAKIQPAPSPAAPVSAAKQMIDKVQQEQLAPLNEVVAAEPTPAKPAPATVSPEPGPAKSAEPTVATPPPVEPAVVSPPAPVKPPPPPPPSMAFKAWVVNLKIRGVRGGESQRVFIGKTSYVPGDVVNPQLGIIFTGYDENTRMLTFQDKTGATFERRD